MVEDEEAEDVDLPLHQLGLVRDPSHGILDLNSYTIQVPPIQS